MALRGVWQLQKLVVSYCDWGGSSRGIRAFMNDNLPAFKEKNPQLEVVTELIRGRHPHLQGQYKNRNLSEEFKARGYPVTCDQAKECTGKKSGEASNKTCNQTPKCSRDLDDCHEILH